MIASIPLPLAALVLYWLTFVRIANARSLPADFLASTDGSIRLSYSIIPRRHMTVTEWV